MVVTGSKVFIKLRNQVMYNLIMCHLDEKEVLLLTNNALNITGCKSWTGL